MLHVRLTPYKQLQNRLFPKLYRGLVNGLNGMRKKIDPDIRLTSVAIAMHKTAYLLSKNTFSKPI